MAQNSNKGDSGVGARIKREMDAMKSRLKDQGMDEMEIKRIMQDYLVKASPKKPAKKMTAAKGGMAKKKMAVGGVAKKKKMMRGGAATKAAPKRMRGGGMAKMAKKK